MLMSKISHDLLVGSLNVRGLNNSIKSHAIFNSIKSKNIDIFMLQECNCLKEESSTWEEEWDGNYFFSYGSKHSKGTMIFFKPGLYIDVISKKCILT